MREVIAHVLIYSWLWVLRWLRWLLL